MLKLESMEEKQKENLDLLFVGDIHGELKHSIWKITEQHRIRDANIVYCGDFGAGFGRPKAMDEMYKEVQSKLEKNNLYLWVMRGNHDNQDFFDGLHNYPRLCFLQDHVLIKLSGKTIYPVGGGTSIDKEWRIEKNNESKKYGSRLRYWWPGERIVRKYVSLHSKVDIVVSHEAPLDFSPVTIRTDFTDEIYEEIIEDRKYLGWVLRQLKPERWFHGHYHQSSSGDFLGTLYRGLAINELFMLYNEE